MSAFRERLTTGKHLILDGGFGTLLMARGLKPGEPPDLWNVTAPRTGDVVAAHRAYVEAGSEAIHANTFGANPVRLAQFGLADRCEEINAAAVELARQAGPRFVIGDVGPTGEYLPPVGNAEPAQWRGAFERQGRALASAGVDALHIETMSDLREAKTALEAMQSTCSGVPIVVSLTFDRKRKGFFTAFGDKPLESFEKLVEGGAAAVGANCSVSSTDMQALVGQIAAKIKAPMAAQPNAGQPRMPKAGGQVVYDQSPDAFAADLAAMAGAGVRILGGCCGTDPRFISALKAHLDQLEG